MQSTELSKRSRIELGRHPECRYRNPNLNRLCFVPIYRYHRPVQVYRTAARPGRHLALVINEATVILPQKTPRSTPYPKIFLGEGSAVLSQSLWAGVKDRVTSITNSMDIPPHHRDGPARRQVAGKEPRPRIDCGECAASTLSRRAQIERGTGGDCEPVEPQKRVTRSCRSRRPSPLRTTG